MPCTNPVTDVFAEVVLVIVAEGPEIFVHVYPVTVPSASVPLPERFTEFVGSVIV